MCLFNHFVQIPIQVPDEGFEAETPTFVEIYLDNVFMAKGDPVYHKPSAMYSAYASLSDALGCQSTEDLADNKR